METALRPTSSNVTVEYTDPFGLFNSVNSLLSEILPLRNLHWKSPTRPLRSIDSLHIDFLPSQGVVSEPKRLSDGGGGGAVSQRRRHQIPGLRPTPYLKIYLLRCDDNETYKTTSRKQLREWIKSRASPAPQQQSGSGSQSQDNHDAFEWLVIHAVPYGSDTAEKAPPASKWPGQRSTSVLEKVKADFNGSSKNAVDRVVQLKLPKDSNNLERKSPELAAQLEDLVSKLKSLILTSFDLRVAQYEEDIREKDSQRSLPGWNFCTFFILKEGLSLGFEDVGLYEDALVGYDELSVGLDAALSEESRGTGAQHGATFLPYSKDLKAKAEKYLEDVSHKAEENSDESGSDASDDQTENGGDTTDPDDRDPIALDPDRYPLDPNRKPYRDMILANNISVFDFRAYIFSRQLLLLLKAAKSDLIRRERSAARPSSQGQTKGAEDLALLSEICRRASEFIPFSSRVLRQDLEAGLAQLEEGSYEDGVKQEVVDNLVLSWIYSAVSQVLIQTSTPVLQIPKVSLRTTRDLVNASIIIPFTDSRPGLPKRSSSLISPTYIPSPRSPGPESVSGGRQPSRPPLLSLKRVDPAQETAGALALVAFRGDLYLLARSALDNMGRKRKWGQSWQDLALLYFEEEDSQLSEVSLSDDEPTQEPQQARRSQALAEGIDDPSLNAAVRGSRHFDVFYEKITDQIFCHYVAANRTRSAELALADMALLKYRSGDYVTSASYFHQLVAFYDASGWTSLQGATLELYSRSIKHLDRHDEYVQALLKLLGLYAGTARAESSATAKSWQKRLSSLVPSSFSSTTREKISAYVAQLCDSSHKLSREIRVQLVDFFGSISIDGNILHFDDKDGFRVQVSLRFLLGESVQIDGVRMRLVNASDSQNGELWLKHNEGVTVKSMPTRILLDSSTTVEGKYVVDFFELRMGNIVFQRRYGFDNVETAGLQGVAESWTDKAPAVMCYPPAEGLEAKLSPSRLIDLGGLRTVEVELKSGWNEIRRGAIRLKPATAGLRLLVAEASVVRGTLDTEKNTASGHIEFENLLRNSDVTLSIPYRVDGSHSTLSTRVEVLYETAHGQFTYSSTSTILSTLPVSVNVQDIFKDDVLFSKFTVSPSMMIPIRVLDCEMAGPEAYEVTSGMRGGEVFDVFPKQPASLLYKIQQRNENSASAPRNLRLTIEFACINEECLNVLQGRFTQDLLASPFRALARLLLPHFLQTFRAQWTAKDLEVLGLVREIGMLPWERFQWGAVTASIGGELEKQVGDWLLKWHKANETIPLPSQTSADVRRRLIIPVDIPEIQVVHTAELVLQPKSLTTPWPVGSMIQADLHLRHTRRWCPPDKREPQSELTFSYEVLAHPELWLIGGRRRGNFAAAEAEGPQGKVFKVMLMPQRPGTLLLPSVEVKTYGPPAPGTAEGTTTTSDNNRQLPAAVQKRLIVGELDYKNHSETVVLVPDLKMTTVGVGPAGGAGESQTGMGTWLVASERRSVASTR